MSVSLSKRSLHNLEGVHPDLVEVVKKTAEMIEDEDIDFIITEGCRSIEQQRINVQKGASQTMHSRHLGGFAVDYVALLNGRVSYDEESMKRLSEYFLRAGAKLRIPLVWGGVWKTLHDTPHIELSKERYPDDAA